MSGRSEVFGCPTVECDGTFEEVRTLGMGELWDVAPRMAEEVDPVEHGAAGTDSVECGT